MIETLAENDEAILELYYEDMAIPTETLLEAIRRNTVNNSIVPVVWECLQKYRSSYYWILLSITCLRLLEWSHYRQVVGER